MDVSGTYGGLAAQLYAYLQDYRAATSDAAAAPTGSARGTSVAPRIDGWELAGQDPWAAWSTGRPAD